MSEHYSHIAVYEDTVTLLSVTNKLPHIFKTALSRFYDSGLLASTSRDILYWAIPILEKYKTANPAKAEDETLMKLAAAIGWLTHRGADLAVKPILKLFDSDKSARFNNTECSVYFDAEIYRQVYDSGKKTTRSTYNLVTPFSFTEHFNLAKTTNAQPAEAIEQMMSFYMITDWAMLNPFVTTEKDCDIWMKKMQKQLHDYHEDYRMYIEAVQNPREERTRAYLIDKNYYNPNDGIIKTVRSITDIETTKQLPESLFTESDKLSVYARALSKAYKYTTAGIRFYQNEISKKELFQIIEANDKRDE
ncbi:MAG: hypothetical protein NTZ35_01365 [Ignavibacteriales bacterium]|nr:hypothetical protein [Ignavibacteriales bacterium]